MIYLDTSAFIKLYLQENGSAEVQAIVSAQDHPLPVWSLLEIELCNAIRYKIFLKEIPKKEAEHLISIYQKRKQNGFYYFPLIDPSSFLDVSLTCTQHTATLGCRALDIQHVAAALLLNTELFVTADKRQAPLAIKEGLKVQMV